MEVHLRRSYLRPTALLLVFLLHGGLTFALLHSKFPYRAAMHRRSSPTTIFFIDAQPRRTPVPRPPIVVERQLLPDLPVPNIDTTTPLEAQGSAAAPTVDWFAEIDKSTAEFADPGRLGRAEEPSSLPPASAPWDPHAHLLEFTGHGLNIRIPVRIPGKI
jgi:hypothetical protein